MFESAARAAEAAARAAAATAYENPSKRRKLNDGEAVKAGKRKRNF